MNGERRLEFGVQLDPRGPVARSAQARESEGFDYLIAGEHLLFHRGGQSALVRLAAAAGATTSIRLVSAIVSAALYPAAMLAWLAMTLDQVSEGRFELGLGMGGEFEQEFAAAGVDHRDRAARFEEALVILRRLWQEDDVSVDMRFNRFTAVSMRPKPVRRTIPIWIGGRGEGAIKRAARFGDGWMPYMYSPEQLAASIERVAEHARSVGRDPARIRNSIYVQLAVGEDGPRTKRVAAEWLRETFQQDLDRVVDRYLVTGTPDECVARLREYRDAGATAAFVVLAAPEQDVPAMLDLMKTEILPQFRGDRTSTDPVPC